MSLGQLLPLSSEDTWGFFPAAPGALLGKNGRYRALRLLGYGQYSSTILVSDSSAPPVHKFKAVKVLTTYATALNMQGILHEVDVLKKVTALDSGDVLPFLEDEFKLAGPHGDHIALVLSPLSTSLETFRCSAPRNRLPLHTVKLAVASVLMALTKLHSLGIIHADVKASNVLFDAFPDTEQVEHILETTSVSQDGDVEINGKKYPVLLPQPLTHQYKWDDAQLTIEFYGFILSDLGSARFESDPQDYLLGTSTALRAPEILIEAGYDAKIDIWAVGCLTFELLTGFWAFRPEATDAYSAEEDHLSRILELTGEKIPLDLLMRGRKSPKYFSPIGSLPRVGPLSPVSLEETLKRLTTLPDKHIGPTAEFIRTCFRLDPKTRPSAKELELHQWLGGASVVVNYQDPQEYQSGISVATRELASNEEMTNNKLGRDKFLNGLEINPSKQ